MTPIPTPYDITEIPHVAWEPGAWSWLGLIALLAIVALRAYGTLGSFRDRKGARLVNDLFAELMATSKGQSAISLERASRIGRRLASHLSGINLAELSCDELKAYPAEELPHSLRDAITSLALMEELGYSPPSPERDTAARAAVLKLAAQLSEYRLMTRTA